MNKDNQLVYSTELGRIKPQNEPIKQPKGDGIVRLVRQTSGRKGKGVCLITGLDLDSQEMQLLASSLKKKLGCGGVVKEGNIEIQGDKRELIKAFLEEKGYKVKLAGG